MLIVKVIISMGKGVKREKPYIRGFVGNPFMGGVKWETLNHSSLEEPFPPPLPHHTFQIITFKIRRSNTKVNCSQESVDK